MYNHEVPQIYGAISNIFSEQLLSCEAAIDLPGTPGIRLAAGRMDEVGVVGIAGMLFMATDGGTVEVLPLTELEVGVDDPEFKMNGITWTQQFIYHKE